MGYEEVWVWGAAAKCAATLNRPERKESVACAAVASVEKMEYGLRRLKLVQQP